MHWGLLLLAAAVAAAACAEPTAGCSQRLRRLQQAPAAAPERKFGGRDLKAVLERVAINKEVIAAVANARPFEKDPQYGRSMVQMWAESLQRAGVKNFLIIAIDDAAADRCESMALNYWRADPVPTAAGLGNSRAISALKFQLIKAHLLLGYSVLMSDTDIVTFKNPFDHLYRDSDIETMTDGFDDGTAYGFAKDMDDPEMGWGRLVRTFQVVTLNSGLFYTRPSERTIGLMDRITQHLNGHADWDQVVYNLQVWHPSHHDYISSHVSLRIMDIYDFVNSKTLFKIMRHDPRFTNHLPVMVHINYHPDKMARMVGAWQRYAEGKHWALNPFPIAGSGPHTRRRVRHEVRH